jgi:serine/threonine protein kinase
LKIISKQKLRQQGLVNQFQNEVKIFSSLDHKNIIKFNSLFDDAEKIYLVMELANQGSLYQRIKQKKQITEIEAKKYFKQIAKAIQYLHTRSPPIIHRDLKPENILIQNEQLKLCDFGWSNLEAENQV